MLLIGKGKEEALIFETRDPCFNAKVYIFTNEESQMI